MLAIISIVIPIVACGEPIGEKPMPSSRPVTQVFVAGGSTGLDDVRTPWFDRMVSWTIKGDMGIVAAGRLRTDADGMTRLRFNVPEVRAAVHLALVIRPENISEYKLHVTDVVVLPKDPFANVKRTLEKLTIGLLDTGTLAMAFRRIGLTYTALQDETARSTFKGNVVILGRARRDLPATIANWLESLSAGTHIVVVGYDRAQDAQMISLVRHLAEIEPSTATTLFVQKESLVWTDLPPRWLESGCPPRKLVEPRKLMLLNILAGHCARDGSIYPLAIESLDLARRSWLVWNLDRHIGDSDPRWDLVLRNSLLWAYRRTLARQGQ